MDQSITYIEDHGLPLCDFQISNEAMAEYKNRAHQIKNFQRVQSEVQEQSRFVRQFSLSPQKYHKKYNLQDGELDIRSKLKFTNELKVPANCSDSGSNRSFNNNNSFGQSQRNFLSEEG